MKARFATALLSFVLLPPMAEAQNVLLPSTPTTTTKAATATQPKTTEATKPAPSYSLDDALAQSPTVAQATRQDTVATQTQNVLATTYAAPAQINSLIQMEQNNISMMQSAVNNMQQTSGMLSASVMPRNQMQFQNGTSQAAINTVGNSQQAIAASTTQMIGSQAGMQAQLARAQYRLKILQSGPLKLSELTALYQNGL